MATRASRMPTLEPSRHEVLPVWAQWRGRDASFTVGVEEEVILLDGETLLPAPRSAAVLAALEDDFRRRISPETHACVVESKTGVHRRVADAIAEMATMRKRLGGVLTAMGMRAACTGTHPIATVDESETSHFARYRRVAGSMRMLVRREPTMALHVHVGVREADDAVRVLNRLREAVPMLLSLSANSPFLHGADSGFCSTRTMIFGGFPRTGAPRAFESYPDYVSAVEPLIASGALPDPTFLWWDVRLQPRLGTVEVRLMDAQTTPVDAAPLVALVQSLARLELEGDGSEDEPTTPEVMEENRFLAARDGAAARLIVGDPPRRRPVGALLKPLLEECRPHAAALGCEHALAGAERLLAGNGAARQRAVARQGEPPDLVRALAERFTQ